jgi:hypothetical protein
MSLIKNNVKEIKTVKSMSDISELKNERETIKRKLEELDRSYEKHHLIVENETRILKVIRELDDLSTICFEGQEESNNSAKKVIDAFANSVEESNKLSKSIEEEILRVNKELRKVNDKLSVARAGVR